MIAEEDILSEETLGKLTGGEGKAACCPEQVMTLSRKAKNTLRKNVQV